MDKELLNEVLSQKIILMDRILTALQQVERLLQTEDDPRIEHLLAEQQSARERIDKCDQQIGMILNALPEGVNRSLYQLISGDQAPEDDFEKAAAASIAAYKDKLATARELTARIGVTLQERYGELREKLNALRQRGGQDGPLVHGR